jgi:putative Mg2+ transporter-C (MgtC) family protein
MSHDLQTLAEVALAMLLGGVIGLERETANKPAGFRTHMLVAGAAAFLVALGFSLVEQFVAHTADTAISADPIRVVQAVIIGVSFLGTGTIFRVERGERIQGLTTAASLLMSSAIGIAVALRHTLLAAGVTILTTVVLRVIGWIEGRMEARNEAAAP